MAKDTIYKIRNQACLIIVYNHPTSLSQDLDINTCIFQMGDWFLFYMLGQNVDSMIFKEVMHELARKLGHLGKDFSDT